MVLSACKLNPNISHHVRLFHYGKKSCHVSKNDKKKSSCIFFRVKEEKRKKDCAYADTRVR